MSHDKAFWKAVAEADYAVPDGENIRDLTAELLSYLGSPDMELRDGIAYMVMAHWADRGIWSPDDFRYVLHAVGPKLMSHTGPAASLSGKDDPDGAILRSFAALTLSLVAYGDWKHPFSEPDEFDSMLTLTETYLISESDLRGYVEGIGWVHATAHTADIFKFLARNRHAAARHLSLMLSTIATKLLTPVTHVFVHSEDERLAMAVLDIVKRELLSADQLSAFVQRLGTVVERDTGGPFDATVHATYMNVKHFLRAMYFRLSFAAEQVPAVQAAAQEAYGALKSFRY